jgi:hypothetical protein
MTANRDMELRAAKALGIEPDDKWHPLTNPEQAMRLSVGLHIIVDYAHGRCGWHTLARPEWKRGPNYVKEHGFDPVAATCHAIVLAAAEFPENWGRL